jgi:CRP/FNR family transcriptional regulator
MLSPSKRDEFISQSISRKFSEGEFVTHRNDVWPYLLCVQSGEFQALKESVQGRSLVIEVFRPGEIFWGIALFETEKPNPVAFQASTDGELLLWHKTQMEEIIADNPRVAWGLFNVMAQRMSRASQIVEELAFQPLAGRLANLLLDKYENAVGDFVARDLTLDAMAARIGTTREMVCKLLYQFSDKKIIELHRTEIKINDQGALENIIESTQN